MLEKSEQEIMTQIESMLRLSNDEAATEEERDNALRFAEKLMTKHKIERHRLNPDAYEQATIEHDMRWFEDQRWGRQQQVLAEVLRPLLYVRVLALRKRRLIDGDWKYVYGLQVLGRPDDIKIFNTVFRQVQRHMFDRKTYESMVARATHNSRITNSWHHSFLRGYLSRLDDMVIEAVRERENDEESKAIVTISQTELEEAFAAIPSRSMSLSTKVKQGDAYFAGSRSASSAPLHSRGELKA